MQCLFLKDIKQKRDMIQRRSTLPPSRTGLSLKSKQKDDKIDETHGSPQVFSKKKESSVSHVHSR